MNRTANFLALPALALTLQGCAIDMVELDEPDVVLTESHGSVWVPADKVEFLQCGDGTLLVCDTPISRYSDRLCHCVR
jgi:hypothetical protein